MSKSPWNDLKVFIRYQHPLDRDLSPKDRPAAEVTTDVAVARVLGGLTRAGLDEVLQSCPAAAHLLSLNTPSGQRGQASQLRKIARLLGCWDWHEVDWVVLDEVDFSAILNALKACSASPASYRTARLALRGVFRHAFTLGYIDEKVFARSMQAGKNLPGGDRHASGRYVDAEERAQMAHLIDQNPNRALRLRNKALLAILFLAGLRRDEIVSVDMKHLDLTGKELLVHGKGERKRTVPINEALEGHLLRWIEVRGVWSGALFCPVLKSGSVVKRRLGSQSIYELVRSISDPVRPMSPHDGRRTFASNLIDQTGDLSSAQRLLGHARLDTTAIYDRRSSIVDRRAVAQLEDVDSGADEGES